MAKGGVELSVGAIVDWTGVEGYFAIDEDQADDYDHLKDALLQKFNISPETYRQRFQAVTVPEGESPT